jgi:hypothetical protein
VLVLVPLRVLVVIVWNFVLTTTFELSVGAGAGDRTKKRPTNSVTMTMMRTMTRYRQRQRGWSQKLCAFFMKFMCTILSSGSHCFKFYGRLRKTLSCAAISSIIALREITLKMFWAWPPAETDDENRR